MQNILINCEPVELYKILKFENIASSGGEAKLMIENAYWTTRVTERDLINYADSGEGIEQYGL